MDFELLTFPCREMIKLSIHTGVRLCDYVTKRYRDFLATPRSGGARPAHS